MKVSLPLVLFVGLVALAWAGWAGPAPRLHRPALAFVLSDENGFRVDSRTGLVTKDMIGGPDTTIYEPFTPREMSILATLMRRRHLLEVTQPRPAAKWEESGDPNWMDTLDVTLDGVHRRWVWQEPRLRPGAPEEWTRLFSVVDSIYVVVTNKQGYRRLPPVRGLRL